MTSRSTRWAKRGLLIIRGKASIQTAMVMIGATTILKVELLQVQFKAAETMCLPKETT